MESHATTPELSKLMADSMLIENGGNADQESLASAGKASPAKEEKHRIETEAPAPTPHHAHEAKMRNILGIGRLSAMFSGKAKKDPQAANQDETDTDEAANKPKRFRPIKRFPIESRLFEWAKYVDSIIADNELKRGVIAPPGISVNDWITVNLFAIYNHINDIYGRVVERFCTATACPIMSAGKRWEYKWGDGKTVKKPISIPAKDYIEYLMEWVESELDDPMIYPTYEGSKYSKKFLPSAKTIVRRLLRAFAHIETVHQGDLQTVGEAAHMDSVLKHFLAFAKTFKLLEKKALDPFLPTLDRWKLATQS